MPSRRDIVAGSFFKKIGTNPTTTTTMKTSNILILLSSNHHGTQNWSISSTRLVRLDSWGNENTGSSLFPINIDLCIEFLSDTILRYYIEKNVNNLKSTGCPSICQLQHKQKGKSTTRTPFRGKSNSRSTSYNSKSSKRNDNTQYRSNQSNHSTTPGPQSISDELIDCNIYGYHYEGSTIGCLNLLCHYNVTQYIKDEKPNNLRSTVDDMVHEISWSTSRD